MVIGRIYSSRAIFVSFFLSTINLSISSIPYIIYCFRLTYLLSTRKLHRCTNLYLYKILNMHILYRFFRCLIGVILMKSICAVRKKVAISKHFIMAANSKLSRNCNTYTFKSKECLLCLWILRNICLFLVLSKLLKFPETTLDLCIFLYHYVFDFKYFYLIWNSCMLLMK